MILIADSAVQLSPESLDELGVNVVEYPMYLNGEPYPVSIRMGKAEKDALRALLKDKDNKVTTSGLKEEELLELYGRFPGERILSLHQSGKASTVTAAVIRKIVSEHKELDVTYLDSHHLTAAYSVLVKDTAEAIKAGASYEDVIARFDRARAATRHLGVVYDLFYLHRTGRIGLAKAVLGTALKIISILGSSEEPGVLKSIGKVKNYAQANQRFAAIVKEDMEAKGARRLSAVISVIGPHEEEAEHLRKSILDLGYDASVEVSYTNHSNMPHAGPDFYDIGYIAWND
ncbi:MAG: DegV family EDD domain-containing protein [Spirochaetes bacterium]|nr:DegV family EDD domain-containing protein [Spirochaetota bacterium]MBU1081045.1 DegV family EDD domain-containing protein [Spirochaetota bacterium]